MRVAAAISTLLILTTAPQLTLASDCLSPFGGGGAVDSIHFRSEIGSPLDNAINAWNTGCPGAIPQLKRTFDSTQMQVWVDYFAVGQPCDGLTNACACAQQVPDSTGTTQYGFIEVYGATADGNECTGDLAGTLAHEIGHTLGLDDVYNSECSNNVMYGYTTSGIGQIGAAQCNYLDLEWQVTGEDECDTEPAPRGCDNGIDQPGSPILVDLLRDGFRFSSPEAGVSFDITADGVAEQMSWVADGNDAFLARDLNGNLRIDDGGELFGNHTRLANGSPAANGFEALAELDQPAIGGDGDGVLTPEDWIFYDLLLWTDLNLDGVTNPGELIALSESSVKEIWLTYRTTHQRDQFGNYSRYWSLARLSMDGKVLPTKVVDVFFQIGD